MTKLYGTMAKGKGKGKGKDVYVVSSKIFDTPNIVLYVQRLEKRKLIIDCILRTISNPWHLKYLIIDIKELSLKYDSISFKYVFRETNFTADYVASIGYICWDLQLWHNWLT